MNIFETSYMANKSLSEKLEASNKKRSIKESNDDSDIYYWDGKSEVPGDVKKVVIQDGVELIGDNFSHHYNLIDVFIPGSVIDIGEEAFWNCKGLESVTISDGVEIIEDDAFRDCIRLKSITIPDSVKKIGEYAFYFCKGLTSVTIGKGVKSIGYGAFGGTALKSIIIPDSVKSIGNVAFRNCAELTDVIIGKGVKSISYAAFKNCVKLTNVKFEGDISKIKFDDNVFEGTPYEKDFNKLSVSITISSNEDDDYLEDEYHPVLVYANSSADFRDWDEAYDDVKNDINDFKSSSKSGDYLIIIKAEGEAWHPIGCAAFLINKNGKIINKTEEFSDESDYDEIEKYAKEFLNSDNLAESNLLNEVKSKFDEIFEDGNKIIAIDDIFYSNAEDLWFDNDDIKKYTDLGYIKNDDLVFPKGTTFTVFKKVGPSGFPVLTLDKTGDDFDFAADGNEERFVVII